MYFRHHRVRENTIASFKSAAKHVSWRDYQRLVNTILDDTLVLNMLLFVYLKGAAFVEFDVHLSKDAVPIIYHDLTCCISTKKVNEMFLVLSAWTLLAFATLIIVPSHLTEKRQESGAYRGPSQRPDI